MRTESEVKALIKEFASILKEDGIESSKFAFEVGYYLKSLASMERDPIVSELSRDKAFIQKTIDSIG
jgi:hypothetical protein